MLSAIPRKNREMSYYIWTSYHQAKLNGARVLDQTELFFERAPEIKEKFEASSNRRIVQFGAGIGTFISTCQSAPQRDHRFAL